MCRDVSYIFACQRALKAQQIAGGSALAVGGIDRDQHIASTDFGHGLQSRLDVGGHCSGIGRVGDRARHLGIEFYREVAIGKLGRNAKGGQLEAGYIYTQ